MPAENQTVTIPAGDSLRIDIPVVGQDGAALLLDGATVAWWVGKSQWSSGDDVLVKKSTDDGIALSGSTASVTILPADTANLPPCDYFHAARVTFPDGKVFTVATGKFVISPSMT